jgi:hypothetical protein
VRFDRLAGAALALTLGGCGLLLPSLWDVGSDPRGKHLKAEAEPVVAALQRYHSDTGHWPEKLDALVPAYLAVLPPGVAFDPKVETLHFDYVMPWPQAGETSCSIQTGKPQWRCIGYI